jgi:hypothetical protein
MPEDGAKPSDDFRFEQELAQADRIKTRVDLDQVRDVSGLMLVLFYVGVTFEESAAGQCHQIVTLVVEQCLPDLGKLARDMVDLVTVLGQRSQGLRLVELVEGRLAVDRDGFVEVRCEIEVKVP